MSSTLSYIVYLQERQQKKSVCKKNCWNRGHINSARDSEQKFRKESPQSAGINTLRKIGSTTEQTKTVSAGFHFDQTQADFAD